MVKRRSVRLGSAAGRAKGLSEGAPWTISEGRLDHHLASEFPVEPGPGRLFVADLAQGSAHLGFRNVTRSTTQPQPFGPGLLDSRFAIRALGAVAEEAGETLKGTAR